MTGKTTKATIEIIDDGKSVTMSVTFDPAPVSSKDKPTPAANIASAIINAFNAKCMFIHGGVIIDSIKIPQLNIEYTEKEIKYSALHEITRILKDFAAENIGGLEYKPETTDKGETPDAETIPAKPKLH